MFFVVVGIEPGALSDLSQVAEAGDGSGGFFGARQGWEEHGCEDRDDCDDHQEFNQCKREVLSQMAT